MLNFLSKYDRKMQLYLKQVFKFFRQQNKIKWMLDYQKRFDEIKTFLTEQLSNTKPGSNQPVCLLIFGICAAVLHSFHGTKKVSLKSANSRIFTQAELRLSTLIRECTTIIYSFGK